MSMAAKLMTPVALSGPNFWRKGTKEATSDRSMNTDTHVPSEIHKVMNVTCTSVEFSLSTLQSEELSE